MAAPIGVSLPPHADIICLQEDVADLRVEAGVVEHVRAVLRLDPGRERAQRRLDALPEGVERLRGVVVDGLLGQHRLVGIALLWSRGWPRTVAPSSSSSSFSSFSAI